MNIERFIARRLVRGGTGNFSAPVIRIAVASVALGIAVMIIAVAIVTGFQNQIREKIIGFGSHIQIAKFDSNNSYEFEPISKSSSVYRDVKQIKGVKNIQVFGAKAGIIKTAEQIQGVVFKGVGNDFDWSFFNDKMVSGNVFSLSDTNSGNEVIISQNLADLLKIKVGDPLRMYFILDNQTRARRFLVSGIYNTGLAEFDLKFIFGDIRQIQKLNGWSPDMVSGFDVFINNFSDLDAISDDVYNTIGYELNARSVREMYPQMFDWLELQDMNVIIILILMLLVSGMAMISTILILILERTAMIGILKALGARNLLIRRVFLYNAAYITGKGLLIGNGIGILLCLLQLWFGFFKLPQESYFMSVVPVNLNVLHILALNFGTLVLCTLMMIVPSFIVTRISPVKAIRFD